MLSYLLFLLSLFKTLVDKCGVSRLISGVDTIKIEDSVNTRPGKLYKVKLILVKTTHAFTRLHFYFVVLCCHNFRNAS